ncbi:hypothetical protein BJX68DRAFT_268810 [Aspergillus pseudodeflectus]|uniref:Uncharacterized protein n=1 Tax=Aspergillus pseudodeflectus TaxID=176178 RepID=A0ABR4K223_9EURO
MRILNKNASRKARTTSIASVVSTNSSHDEESHKVAVSRSLGAALWSCAIHLLPIAVSSTIIALNIRGTYLGADLMSPVRSETINLMLFQLAAKAHEITIVASLGIIVLQFVRHELLWGDGLPLGLLGSGLAFNHLEYFFSKEFYGSLRYVPAAGVKSRKVALIVVIIIAGIIATLAGPASAVLLVPESQDWSAGGTPFYLSGTEDVLWPSSLAGDLSELQQLCGNGRSTHLGVCPGGGYQSLWSHWGTLNSSTYQSESIRPYAKELSGSQFYWRVSSPSSMVAPLYALGDVQPGPNGKTTLVQPHAAPATVLQQVSKDWWEALSVQKGLAANQVDDRVAAATFKNAITVARCGPPEKLSADRSTVHFPSINGRFNYADNLPLEVDTLSPNRTDHLRFQWVHLPARFGAASIGAVFESPWESQWEGSASRAVMGCTVQAGWVPATVYTDKYTFWTGWYPWNILFGDRTPVYNPGSSESTNGRVAFGGDWLSLLTPPAPTTAPDASDWQPSTIESIFVNAGLAAGTQSGGTTETTPLDDWLAEDTSSWQMVSLVESIICSVVVDGLSRTGSHRVFDTSGPSLDWPIANYTPLHKFNSLVLDSKPALQPPSNNPEEYITLQATMKISGFSMQSSLATYLSMSVLLVHMVMATIHIIFLLVKRHTSGSWSTVGELIALAQNSPPAYEALANTGAGIQHSKTYSHVARIRTIRDAGSAEAKRIELQFEEPPASVGTESDNPGRELHTLRDTLLRHPATWPKHRARYGGGDGDAWGSTGSREHLVPGLTEPGREAGRVQLDSRYG